MKQKQRKESSKKQATPKKILKSIEASGTKIDKSNFKKVQEYSAIEPPLLPAEIILFRLIGALEINYFTLAEVCGISEEAAKQIENWSKKS